MSESIISFAAHHAVIDIHYHHCFQIVVSIHNTFDCKIADTNYSNFKGFVINQRHKHSCMAKDSSVIVFLIDAESSIGQNIKKLLNEKIFLNIEDVLSAEQLQLLQVNENERFDIEILSEKYALLCQMLFLDNLEIQPLDSRIEQAIKYIETNISQKIELSEIADLTHLSGERLRHLFAEQIGIPFSQYILWKRIKKVIYEVLKKDISLADASIQYGFSDDAHFSKTYKRMFGASAKPMLKNSRYIQFLNPSL